jgi:hypothetical protein
MDFYFTALDAGIKERWLFNPIATYLVNFLTARLHTGMR